MRHDGEPQMKRINRDGRLVTVPYPWPKPSPRYDMNAHKATRVRREDFEDREPPLPPS